VSPQLDAIVVGAGPAGAMAAHRLGAAGAQVRVLEAAELPRTKPCGGGILGLSRRPLPVDIVDLVDAQVGRCLRLYDHQRPVWQPVGDLTFVDRAAFDLQLIDSACSRYPSVVLETGARVREVDVQETGVRVRTECGRAFRSKFLVAADGVYSRTARCLGLNRRPLVAAAMDVEMEVTPEAWQRESAQATFNHFCIADGYAWIFPKRPGRLSCGIGSWRRRHRVPAAMGEFLARSFRPGEILQQTKLGYPIPLYRDQRPIATARVCLAGDAASLVEPVMGEGIRFALISGDLAGRAVADCLAGHATDCLPYQKAVQDRFANSFFDLSRFILPVLLQAPETFYRKFIEGGANYHRLAAALGSRLD